MDKARDRPGIVTNISGVPVDALHTSRKEGRQGQAKNRDMARTLTTLKDLCDLDVDTVIDVRSPAEFAEDHIPGAINLPVLDNAERARVGTIYTQESPFKARKIGAALVARNAAQHIETTLAEKDGGWKPLVYCWRGGQRSGSFAAILGQIGWRTEVLDGGYRSYRRLVVQALYEDPWPVPLVVLDGNTGTAKTAILARLNERGAQVLDLEGIGRHRGSVLGPVDDPQPSQKAFETGIAQVLSQADPAKPVFVEAESSKVGDLIVPPSLWAAMCAAPRVHIEAPIPARATYLTRAYADLGLDIPRTEGLLDKLHPYHGTERVEGWKAMARAGDAETLAASLIEQHYDPRYKKGREKRDAEVLAVLSANALGDDDIDGLAAEILSLTSR